MEDHNYMRPVFSYWTTAVVMLKPDALRGAEASIPTRLAIDYLKCLANAIIGLESPPEDLCFVSSRNAANRARNHIIKKASKSPRSVWYFQEIHNPNDCYDRIVEKISEIKHDEVISIDALVRHSLAALSFRIIGTSNKVVDMNLYRNLYGHKWDVDFQSRVQKYLLDHSVRFFMVCGRQENCVLQIFKHYLRFVCVNQKYNDGIKNLIHVCDLDDHSFPELLGYCID